MNNKKLLESARSKARNFVESNFVTISFFCENQIIKQTPKIGVNVDSEGWYISSLKNKIECPMRNTPILGSIKLSVLFLLLWPKVISKYAKIEPANNSHILVRRK